MTSGPAHHPPETTGVSEIGAIIPTFGHVQALPEILNVLVDLGLPVLIVDDGNEAATAAIIAELASLERQVEVLRREENGGKGAAMKTGFEAAGQLGWSHALQIDADGQHDLSAVSGALEAARENPTALICGTPIYDASIPKGRKIGREITHFWVRLETLSFEISDSMCGFRIYPLSDTLQVIQSAHIGDRMEFDTDMIVHLNWHGVRCVERPLKVVYPEENTSNFRMWMDNVRISAMHTRLALQMPVRVPIRMLRRRFIKRFAKNPN